MSVDFSQLTNFLRGLERAAVNVEADLKAVAKRHADEIQSGVERLLPNKGDTPWATGQERRHVVVVDDSAHRQFRVEISDIPGREPLADEYHEFGTKDTRAYPAFRPAADEHRASYIKDAEAIVAKRMSEAV